MPRKAPAASAPAHVMNKAQPNARARVTAPAIHPLRHAIVAPSAPDTHSGKVMSIAQPKQPSALSNRLPQYKGPASASGGNSPGKLWARGVRAPNSAGEITE